MNCTLDNMALNLNEKKKLQKFLNAHKINCPNIIECAGHSFVFSSNSKIEVRCSTCGKKHDITDYGG